MLDEYDLTPQQFNLLRILRGQYPKPASITLLKERMLDKMSDASRLVERLLAKGLVERKICPEDRRKVDVVITKKGLKLLEKIDKTDNEMDNYLKNLSEVEAKKLNELLDKLRG
jgi:DNA-binding MarR family transcriptional regulator